MTTEEIMKLLSVVGIVLVVAVRILMEFRPDGLLSFFFGKNVLENKSKENARYGLPPETDDEKQMHRIIKEEADRRKAFGTHESSD